MEHKGTICSASLKKEPFVCMDLLQISHAEHVFSPQKARKAQFHVVS